MDIGKAITFVTEDKEWLTKIGIGAGLMFASSIIPIIPLFFIMGYQIAVARKVMQGEDSPLPPWDDWGKLFTDGAIVWIAQFVYALPVLFIGICVAVVAAFSSDPNSNGIVIALVILLSCLLLLVSIGLAFLVQAVYVQYVRYGDFGRLFRVAEVFAIARENFVDILLILIVSILGAIVIGIATIILLITVCGAIIAYCVGAVWLMFSLAFLYGQIAGRYNDKKEDVPALAA